MNVQRMRLAYVSEQFSFIDNVDIDVGTYDDDDASYSGTSSSAYYA